jgi:uncharacterized protein YjbI with pentapeptide repeats
MRARFRSWWQKNKQVVRIGAVIIVVLIAFAFLVYKFGWNWTGFNGGYSKITKTSTAHGVTTTTVQPLTKTFWDWVQLLAELAIPVVVGFGVAWFTTKQTRAQAQASEAANKQRHETELQITTDNQREAALKAYIDKMSELLLTNNLGELIEDKGARKIARIQTLTVLRRLDAERKGSVLQFLQEAGLISKNNPIIELTGANLSEANLSRANLNHADLREADLSGADLQGADLREALLGGSLQGANLCDANLREANLNVANLEEADLRRADLIMASLSGANLSAASLEGADLSMAFMNGANLSGATVTMEQLEKAWSLKDTTMPDGSKHS